MRTPEEYQQLYDKYEYLISLTVYKRFGKQKFLEAHGLTKDDLIQHGRLGLHRACKEYNQSKKASFKPFAISHIFWSISTECKKESLSRDSSWSFDTIERVSLDSPATEHEDEVNEIYNTIKCEDTGYDEVADREFINAVTKDLPADLADIVKMRVMYNMTLQQIGAKVGKSHQAIRQRLLNNRGKISLAMNLYNQ